MKLDGVIAVVTGGASGIGRATVSALAKAGAKTVYMLDMNAQLGKSAADEINAEFSKDQPVVQFQCCDVTKEETVTELFDCVRSRGEQVNILVNSAGILDEKSWQKTIDVNLKAVVSASYAALEHMGKHNGGQGGIIVNMGSLGGIVVSGFAPIYCATKHAVVAFSRCIADESLYSHHGVRIACICPSYVDTPMVTGRDSKQLYRYEWMAPGSTDVPDTLVASGDVASVIMDFISDDARNGPAVVIVPDSAPYDVDFSSMNKHMDTLLK